MAGKESESDWKPNGRPQSTIARSFSASLNDAFMIDSKLDGLAQSVEQKKQAVSSQSQELEALESRLRETEERLKQKQSKISSQAGVSGGHSSPHRRQPNGTTFSEYQDELQAAPVSPLGVQSPSSQSQPRPGNILPAGTRSNEYRTGNTSQGQHDDRYSHGAGHEVVAQPGQWPPPGTRFE
ncbi:hypothetical protein MMC08_000252 [Hypocenomyce scalaris]|nr:hypothetical protein [Hypocenomyce scalaris]